MKTGHLIRDQFKLRYHIEGEAMPVVVCGSAHYYERVFSRDLSKHFQMIYYDNRVFGGTCLSECSKADFALEKIYQDIEALRQHLRLEKIIILGHSGQAYMALEYAKRYPQYVSHVVMIGMGPTYGEKAQAAAESNWQQIADAARKAKLKQNMQQWSDDYIQSLAAPQNFIKDYIRRTPMIWYDADFDAEKLWENVEFNLLGFQYIWGELFPHLDITQGLDQLNIPVALMLGRYDGLVPSPEAWNSVKHMFKNLVIYVFEKSGHTLPLEEPQLFNQRLLEFIRQ